MKMPYTTNERLPRLRADAVRMVRRGKSTRDVARYYGYAQSTIVKWCKRAPRVFNRNGVLETFSSRPHNSPRRTPTEIEGKIIATRQRIKRCSEVVYEQLKVDGVEVSLSTVKRVLSRYGCLKKRSPWKKKRLYPIRPEVKKQGDLVQFDTIHFVDRRGKRMYVYTALDVFSRYGFAMLSQKANCHRSISFFKKTIAYFSFEICCIQTDNGPEFGLYFTDEVTRRRITHRHIHPRSPNENGHLERFNRTLQEEIPSNGLCIFREKDISKFLRFYNEDRMHMGIKFKTPKQMITE